MLAAGPGYERPPRHDASARTVRRRVRRQAGWPSPSIGSRPHRTVSTSARCRRLPARCSNTQRPNRTRTEPLIADAARLRDSLGKDPDRFVLIGRRHLRSNNSWMHNVPALAGTNRCTLQMHPDDVADLGLSDTAKIKGPGGELLAPIEPMPDAPRSGVAARMGSRPRRYAAGCRVR